MTLALTDFSISLSISRYLVITLKRRGKTPEKRNLGSVGGGWMMPALVPNHVFCLCVPIERIPKHELIQMQYSDYQYKKYRNQNMVSISHQVRRPHESSQFIHTCKPTSSLPEIISPNSRSIRCLASLPSDLFLGFTSIPKFLARFSITTEQKNQQFSCMYVSELCHPVYQICDVAYAWEGIKGRFTHEQRQ